MRDKLARNYKMFISYLRPQVIPSPVYPDRQLQLKLPALLWQSASALQPPLFVKHSLISANDTVISSLYHLPYNIFITHLSLSLSLSRIIWKCADAA